jgi:hypothetical protein
MADESGYWERTWRERNTVLVNAFGDFEPSGTVQAFSWDDRIRLPGACSVAFPPIEKTSNPPRYARDEWLHMSIGLSQPLDKQQVRRERAAGKAYSAFSFELGILTDNHVKWASPLLYWLLTAITDGEEINWGDRFPFRFHKGTDDSLSVMIGGMREQKPERVGQLCALLFWKFLFPHAEFCTDTGKFMIMIATGITQDEWNAAKATSTEHLLLLLCRAGIGQRTIPERQSVFSNSRWEQEWETVKRLNHTTVCDELAVQAKR